MFSVNFSVNKRNPPFLLEPQSSAYSPCRGHHMVWSNRGPVTCCHWNVRHIVRAFLRFKVEIKSKVKDDILTSSSPSANQTNLVKHGVCFILKKIDNLNVFKIWYKSIEKRHKQLHYTKTAIFFKSALLERNHLL